MPRSQQPGRLAALLFLAALFAACGDARTESAVTVTDSAGVTILTSTGDGWDEKAAWGLELDLDIGDLDGPDAFGRLVDVVPRRAGGLWVADAQSRRIRGYGPDGTEVLAFGRPGQGPGEFASVGSLAEDPEGRIAVGGRMPLVLYRFDGEGRPLATEPVEPQLYRDPPKNAAADRPPVGPTLGSWEFAGDGSPFLHTVSLDAPEGTIVRQEVLLRVAASDRPAVRFTRWENPAMEGGPDGAPILLQPTASWGALSDGGIWLTDGADYELRRYDATGGVRTILRRDATPVPITEELRGRIIAGLTEGVEHASTIAMFERAVFPDVLPAIVDLWVSDPGGHLWVGVTDPDLPWRLDEPNAWDIFAPDGRYVGHLPIPAGLRPTHVTEEAVYGVWRDELDVPHARRYEIVRGG